MTRADDAGERAWLTAYYRDYPNDGTGIVSLPTVTQAFTAGRASRDADVAAAEERGRASAIDEYKELNKRAERLLDPEYRRMYAEEKAKLQVGEDQLEEAEERGRAAGLHEASKLAEKVAELSGEDIMLELATKLRQK